MSESRWPRRRQWIAVDNGPSHQQSGLILADAVPVKETLRLLGQFSAGPASLETKRASTFLFNRNRLPGDDDKSRPLRGADRFVDVGIHIGR